MMMATTWNLVFSQVQNTWKGGTPGMEQVWDCHKNWSTYKVPDEFTNVIIPDVSTSSLSAPRLSGQVAINGLFIETGASLTIDKDAQLKIYESVSEFSLHKIDNKGSLILPNESFFAVTKNYLNIVMVFLCRI